MNSINETGNQVPACPICSGNGFQPFKLGLVQCDACSVVLSPAIWQPQANEQMEDEWFGEDYRPETSFWVALFETWNNRRTLARLSNAKSHGHRLLEIGVGSGSFLNAARDQRYEVMGCDLSAPICARVRSAYGIVMHSESLATLSGESRFDVIVMNHVLEHVHSPIAFMEDVRRLLAPGGVVHVAVPNIACWEAVLSGWTSYEPYHLTYFGPRTLARTISTSGLDIEKLVTHDSFSGWFLAILRTALGVNRQSGAVTRPSTSSGARDIRQRSGLVEHTYRVAMVCYGVVIWPLRWVQSRLGRGDELICIARKSPFASLESRPT